MKSQDGLSAGRPNMYRRLDIHGIAFWNTLVCQNPANNQFRVNSPETARKRYIHDLPNEDLSNENFMLCRCPDGRL